MISRYLENIDKVYDHVDSIIIINKDGYVEYSVINNQEINSFVMDNFIGKHVLEVYPSLTEETSNHYRVLRSGKPILNETQELEDLNGRVFTLINSTFPMEFNGELIGTIEASVVISLNEKIEEFKINQEKSSLYQIHDIITQDSEMIKIKNRLMKISGSKSPVMIYGETGTGKELIAQSLHSTSQRKDKPFIAVNCSAIPAGIFESIVFGSETGSYTGAEKKRGLIKQADGGTLFLDELNSLDIPLQAKLLKVIEENQIRPIGSEKVQRVNVRYIAAMNMSPGEAVKKGILRSDLYYRLNVMQINIPPLSKRKKDIALLIDHFIDLFNAQRSGVQLDLSIIAKNSLIEYGWPGNVRELKNAIEYAFHVAEGDRLTLSDLPEYIVNNKTTHAKDIEHSRTDSTLKGRMDVYEKKIIIEALENYENRTRAARALGITRQALQYKIDRLGIEISQKVT